ncbi:MAG: protein-L-isoaspartate(D-aspartate) O-methyltransferase [Deltaproteobacteria bacterium]|nr:protein-L-isoaspartate(D-aspartate) O-methyltransferase [Deltaproteobacteria bacterium]
MVERQLAARGIRDPRVLAAFRSVPRELFVPEGLRASAYQDNPLPIGEGQTISQPYIVALMAQLLELRDQDRVLEVGTGCGFAAAIFSCLAREVYSIERRPDLAEAARVRLRNLGFDRVRVSVGDGSLGISELAPFDAIVVAASGPEIPAALKAQLAVGGRLVMPMGATHRSQRLTRVQRASEHEFDVEDLGAVTFVPLIGRQAWADS